MSSATSPQWRCLLKPWKNWTTGSTYMTSFPNLTKALFSRPTSIWNVTGKLFNHLGQRTQSTRSSIFYALLPRSSWMKIFENLEHSIGHARSQGWHFSRFLVQFSSIFDESLQIAADLTEGGVMACGPTVIGGLQVFRDSNESCEIP